MTQDAGAQLRKGVAEYAVLALLRHEPMYGWQLSQQLIDRGGFIASIGTLYPLLARLRGKGLVSTFDESSASGPARRYYRLTSAGEESLTDFAVQWRGFSASLSALLDPIAHQGETDD